MHLVSPSVMDRGRGRPGSPVQRRLI